MNSTPWPVAIAPVRAWFRRQAAYGWRTILIGALAMTATYPGRTHGLGMVTEPLLHDLRLADDNGRVFYAALNLYATLLGALFCIPVGWLFDRFNPRLILAGNLVLLGIAVVGLASAHSWEVLFVFLILTRGFGQSALSVVSITLVAKAFRPVQLGLAMAWYAIIMAPLHLILIRSVGAGLSAGTSWRTVWLWVGMALVVLAGMALFLGRPTTTLSNAPARPPTGASLRQALATPAFWVIAGTISLWSLIYAGVALFNEAIFRERGFAKEVYFDVLSLVTLIALGAKFLFGWLTRYCRLTHLLSVCLLLTTATLAGLPYAQAIWHVYLYALALGLASGAVALLFFAAWGTLYGPRDLGRIQGIAQMLTVLASACGPLVFSLSKRWLASYSAIFQGLALLVFVLAVLAWFTPLPQFAKEDNP